MIRGTTLVEHTLGDHFLKKDVGGYDTCAWTPNSVSIQSLLVTTVHPGSILVILHVCIYVYVCHYLNGPRATPKV